jgi:hypothetical protein
VNSDQALKEVRELLSSGSLNSVDEKSVSALLEFYENNRSLIADLFDRVADLENQLDELRE